MRKFKLRQYAFGSDVKLNSVGWCLMLILVGHPEREKKSVGIFEYILASVIKVYLDVF